MQVTEKMLRIEKVKPTGGGAKIVTDGTDENATDVVPSNTRHALTGSVNLQQYLLN